MAKPLGNDVTGIGVPLTVFVAVSIIVRLPGEKSKVELATTYKCLPSGVTASQLGIPAIGIFATIVFVPESITVTNPTPTAT